MIRFVSLKPVVDPLFGLLAVTVERQPTALQYVVEIWPVESVKRDLGQGFG